MFLKKDKIKRYSIELPEEVIDVLKIHLKDTFANKTKWFVKAINGQIQKDRNEIKEEITNKKI